MRLAPFFAALGAGVIAFAACSSFDEAGGGVPGDDGGPAPDGSSPETDSAARDAGPCPFGNARFDGGFCDDFDRTTSLSTLWLNVFAMPGGESTIAADDAAASAPNVFRSVLPPHSNTGYAIALATAPILGAHKIDCTFRMNVVDVAANEDINVLFVAFGETPPATRAFAIRVQGSTRFAFVNESYLPDSGTPVDASSNSTGVKLDPGWRRVHLVVEQGKPVTIDIDGLNPYVGPTPAEVAVSGPTFGIGSSILGDAGGATVLYDDVVCAAE